MFSMLPLQLQECVSFYASRLAHTYVHGFFLNASVFLSYAFAVLYASDFFVYASALYFDASALFFDADVSLAKCWAGLGGVLVRC